MYPNFLGIGAQKAGTTWLYANLKNHPDLWLPPIKELHYFNYKQDNRRQTPIDKLKSKRWREILWEQINLSFRNKDLQNLLWNLKYFSGNQSDEWYASLFELGKGKITGEITPGYSALDENSVAHIHKIMPDVKILFILRNPIERAWSNLFMQIKKRGETVESIPVETLVKRCTNNYSISRGNYKSALEIWQSYYPETQFFIGFFEEIEERPDDLLRRIFEFLSVVVSEETIKKIDKRKINSYGNDGTIPNEVRLKLAYIYHEDIKYLSLQYGGYADKWLAYAEECLKL